MRIFAVAATTLLISAASPSVSLAQDVATSEALFQKALDDMNRGAFESACPGFEESLRLDPRPGTLFTLAECFNKAGKSASAVARYQDYLDLYPKLTAAQQAKQNDREKVARDERDRLKPTVPKLTIVLDAKSPEGTVVKRDGVVLNKPSLGIPLPVDPGSHTVTAQAPGGPEAKQTFTIASGGSQQITLRAEPAPGGAAGKPPSADGSTGDTQRIAAYVLGSVGIAGLILGGTMGGLTLAEKSTVDDECDPETKVCRSQEGIDAVDSAQTTGLVSTIGFAAGGACLGTAIIVFFTAPSAPDDAPKVGFDFGPSGGSISLSGRF